VGVLTSFSDGYPLRLWDFKSVSCGVLGFGFWVEGLGFWLWRSVLRGSTAHPATQIRAALPQASLVNSTPTPEPQNPRPKTQNPKPEIQNPRPNTQNTSPRNQRSNSKPQNPKLKPKPNTQDLTPNTRNQKPKPRTTKFGILNPDPLSSNPLTVRHRGTWH